MSVRKCNEDKQNKRKQVPKPVIHKTKAKPTTNTKSNPNIIATNEKKKQWIAVPQTKQIKPENMNVKLFCCSSWQRSIEAKNWASVEHANSIFRAVNFHKNEKEKSRKNFPGGSKKSNR